MVKNNRRAICNLAKTIDSGLITVTSFCDNIVYGSDQSPNDDLANAKDILNDLKTLVSQAENLVAKAESRKAESRK